MKSFFDNLFGKKQHPPKFKNNAPALQKVGKPEEHEFYKKGDVIDGRYEIRSELGKGGFGVVYLAYNRETNVFCALKTFRDELLPNPPAREAFKKEALLWVNLDDHPFIVAARWVTEVSGRLFVIMDYVAADTEGRVSLADHLAHADGISDRNQILKWAIQFCLGVEHTKARGIECHRDIKPANILITQDRTLKITDFGLAAAAEIAWRGVSNRRDSLVTSEGKDGFGFSLIEAEGKVRCGTAGYIAPEVYRYEKADIRSDIYSFGLVLWQMAAGSRLPPFMVSWQGDMEKLLRGIYKRQMTEIVPQVEGSIRSVIERCLRPNPLERYGSFEELRNMLEPILERGIGGKMEIHQASEKTVGFWSNKGCSLDNLGRHEEAISCFNEALTIEPQNVKILLNKSHALDNLSRLDEAIACCDQALAIDPRCGSAWNSKGAYLANRGRYEAAICCYNEALKIDSKYARAWYQKGLCLYELGNIKNAIECYENALGTEPKNANAWYHKAIAHDHQKYFLDAKTSYCKFIAVATPQHAEQITHAKQRLKQLEAEIV